MNKVSKLSELVSQFENVDKEISKLQKEMYSLMSDFDKNGDSPGFDYKAYIKKFNKALSRQAELLKK